LAGVNCRIEDFCPIEDVCVELSLNDLEIKHYEEIRDYVGTLIKGWQIKNK
jgi:hypothetical protein